MSSPKHAANKTRALTPACSCHRLRMDCVDSSANEEEAKRNYRPSKAALRLTVRSYHLARGMLQSDVPIRFAEYCSGRSAPSHWSGYAHVVVSDALVYYKSFTTSEMRECKSRYLTRSNVRSRWYQPLSCVVIRRTPVRYRKF